MKKTESLIFCLAAMLIAGQLMAAEAPPAKFKFLRAGEVQPRGWLLDQIRWMPPTVSGRYEAS